MKQCAAVLALTALCMPGVAMAATANYGWEDGNVTIGGFGDMIVSNDTTTVHSGSRSLKCVDDQVSGTPQAFVGWVTGLTDGQEVTAGFWVYDTTPDVAPSGRVWGSYTSDPFDIESYAGSAGGNETYSGAGAWTYLEHTWTFEVGDPPRDGLVIQVRTYSEPGDTIWVDDLTITAPDGTNIYHPGNFTFYPIPEAAGRTMEAFVDQNVTMQLCADPRESTINYWTIESLPGNGQLWHSGAQITAAPYVINGAAPPTLEYHPNAGWSGMDSFTFTVTDNQAVPQTSAEGEQEIAVQLGGVVITEIMYDPSSFQSTYEFVEIFNYSGGTVDLGEIDAVPSLDRYNKDTTDNLLGESVADGEAKIIAIYSAATYPDSAGQFLCEWGILGANEYSLYASDVAFVNLDNWEFLWAAPDPNPFAECYESAGARVAVYDASGNLRDVVRLDEITASEVPGASYAYKDSAPMPTAASNDSPGNWTTANNANGEMTGGSTGDSANPMYVHTYSTSPDYDVPCYGACCLQDASCTPNLTKGECSDLGGTWKGPDTVCNPLFEDFYSCLSGPGVAFALGCDGSDLDTDGDVDLMDYGLLQGNACPQFCVSVAEVPDITYPTQIPLCVTQAVVVSTFDTESNTNYMSIYLEDQTTVSGLMVWGFNDEIEPLLEIISEGDEVEMKGTLQNYWYTPELFDVYEVTVTGHPGVPAPHVIPMSALTVTHPENGEYQSTVVTIENVVFTAAGGTFAGSTNYEICESGGGLCMDVRVSGQQADGSPNELIGTTIPSGVKDVTGIVDQYNHEYQIKPRGFTDIVDAN